MKLKRICKVEYKDDVAVIPHSEKVKYDVYFIDNEDWLCIDEDDYTPGKQQSRAFEDMHRFFKLYKDNERRYTYWLCLLSIYTIAYRRRNGNYKKMNLKRWAKVEHTESGEAIIPVKIKLFYKYFVDTEDVLWTDRDDEFQFEMLKKFPYYVKDIEDCCELNKLIEWHNILRQMG